CEMQTDPTTYRPICPFVRRLRSTLDHAVTWSVAFSGFAGTTTPTSLTVPAGATRSLTITIDATPYAGDNQFHFGEMTLTPNETELPALHLPIAVVVPPPKLSVPHSVSISLANGNTTSTAPLPVKNVGGPELQITNTNFVDATTTYPYYLVNN